MWADDEEEEGGGGGDGEMEEAVVEPQTTTQARTLSNRLLGARRRTRKAPARGERLPPHERMNRGMVLNPDFFGGSCRTVTSCRGEETCVFRPSAEAVLPGNPPPRHSCRNDPMQRWQCAISRLSFEILSRIRQNEDVLFIQPEAGDFTYLADAVIEHFRSMHHYDPGDDPRLPLPADLSFPNPSYYYGENIDWYVRNVGYHLQWEDGSPRVEVDLDALSLVDVVRTLLPLLTRHEEALLRRRLRSWPVRDRELRDALDAVWEDARRPTPLNDGGAGGANTPTPP